MQIKKQQGISAIVTLAKTQVIKMKSTGKLVERIVAKLQK